MFKINNINIRSSIGDTLTTVKNKIASAFKTLPILLDLGFIENNFINGGNYTIPQPIFYLKNGEIQLGSVEGDDSLNWQKIKNALNKTSELTAFDLDFYKKLYIVSVVQTTINDFGSDTNTSTNYAFLNLDIESPNELNDASSVWLNKAITIDKFKTMIEKNFKAANEDDKISAFYTIKITILKKKYFRHDFLKAKNKTNYYGSKTKPD